MALISCPECRREVSDKAPACPHCGYPINMGGRPARPPLSESSVLSKAVGAIGGWLIVPWIARLLAFVMFCIVLIVMFAKGRS